MKLKKTSLAIAFGVSIAAVVSLSVTAPVAEAGPHQLGYHGHNHKKGKRIPYEIWASDQSNSVAGASARGVDGSYMWIWNSEDVQRQIRNSRKHPSPSCVH